MKIASPFALKPLLAAMLVALAACGGPSLAPPAKPEGDAPQAQFNNFIDVPRLASASMDLDRTLIFGNADNWFGRLAFTSRMSHVDLFDFFKQEMTKYGWEEVSSQRSTVSVLAYKRMGRVGIMQIKSGTVYGSSVEFTVSPQGTSVGYSPGGGMGGQPGSSGGYSGGSVTSQPLR